MNKTTFKRQKMNKAVFLDRDGVINEEVNYLSKVKEFKFIKNVIEALKLLSKTGFKIIIITNQSGINRGYFTVEDLKRIHEYMLKEFKKESIRIDKIYVCPHRPDENCNCRKPKTGLLIKASEDFNINISKSYFIGDKTVDIETGKNANCKTILVKTGYGGSDNNYKVKPDFIEDDLIEAVKVINKI